MLICPNCGAANTDDSKFCENCGTKLEGAAQYVPEESGEINAESAAEPENEPSIEMSSESTVEPGAEPAEEQAELAMEHGEEQVKNAEQLISDLGAIGDRCSIKVFKWLINTSLMT